MARKASFARLARGGKDQASFEAAVQSIAQTGRSVMIRLIVATQRPEAKVVPGIIKGNLSTRIALRLPTLADSMTDFQRSMAEKLAGRGDLVFWPNEGSVERLQGYAD